VVGTTKPRDHVREERHAAETGRPNEKFRLQRKGEIRERCWGRRDPTAVSGVYGKKGKLIRYVQRGFPRDERRRVRNEGPKHLREGSTRPYSVDRSRSHIISRGVSGGSQPNFGREGQEGTYYRNSDFSGRRNSEITFPLGSDATEKGRKLRNVGTNLKERTMYAPGTRGEKWAEG